MIKFVFVGLCTLLGSAGNAGELLRNATIIEVANTININQSFAVLTSGGTGRCAAWIAFPESKAKSPTAHKHAIALAMLALETGKKVRIHNYEDDTCTGANFITVSNGPSSTGNEGF